MLTEGAVKDLALQQGGSYGATRDAIKHYIYDHRFLTAASTANDHTFFQQAVGSPYGTGGIKGIQETNMYDQGRFPNGQNFLVKRMGVSLFAPLVAADVSEAAALAQAYQSIMQASIFEVRVAGRDFDFQVPGSLFVPSVGLYQNAAVAAVGAIANVGEYVASGWVSLDAFPIFIDQMVSFNVVQRLGSGDPATLAKLDDMIALLGGEYAALQLKLEGTLTRAK